MFNFNEKRIDLKALAEIARMVEEAESGEKVTMELSADEALIIEGYRYADEELKGEGLFAFAAMAWAGRKAEGENHGKN